jgi:hypothetical protein
VSHRLIRCTFYAILISGLLAACGEVSTPPIPTPTLFTTPTTLTPTLPLSATPTYTPAPPLAILLAGPDAEPEMVITIQTALNEIITDAGLQWQVRQQLLPADLGSELILVVALPPDPGLATLAAAAPQTQFLAVGIPSLTTAANLSMVGAQVARPDQQGFIAGYIAAMIDPEWRVGVISIGDSVQDRSTRTGFLNGVIFFCGLCTNPNFPPPYPGYPLYFELTNQATSSEWQAAANYMIDNSVSTVYIAPGAGDEAMLSTLASAGINLMGSGVPPESIQANWVISVDTDPVAQVLRVVPQLLQGQGGQDIPLLLEFSYINPVLFTPGKEDMATETLNDLQSGYIDTGVDLSTGENR